MNNTKNIERINIQKLYNEIYDFDCLELYILSPGQYQILTKSNFKDFKNLLLIHILKGCGGYYSLKVNDVYFMIGYVEKDNFILKIICHDWIQKSNSDEQHNQERMLIYYGYK